MLKLNEELQEKISYGLIGLVFVSFLLPLFINSFVMALESQFFAVFCLAGFYALVSEKRDLVFFVFVLFAMQQASFYLLYVSNDTNVYVAFMILAKLPFVLSAIVFGMLAIKHNKEFKAFELMEFLLVIFLLVPSLLDLFKNSDLNEYSKYFVFGICFIISTIMYNNNLWMRYNDNEKNLLLFLLVISFLSVIQSSAKYITF